MQLQNVFLAACAAVSASAAPMAGNGTGNSTDIAPIIQGRLTRLDLGYQKTNSLLDQASSNTGDVTADDVVSQYQKTVQAEEDSLDKNQPVRPMPESSQLVICQSFHSLVLNGLDLNDAFITNADQFNKDQRNSMQQAVSEVNQFTNDFVADVGSKALPYCQSSLRSDSEAIVKSLTDVAVALDPSDALA